MPNWKKVIVSGSDAVLNSVSGSSFVYSGGDVIAQTYLKSLNSTGDEGGELFLNKAVTNTTLTGGVTVDVYQNRLRFFEQGGSARGFYLDITTGGGGASTNLASGGGTVTSVSASGTVSGITLGGGPITGAGTLTLSGTISGLTNSNLSGTAGITNANLANSAITIAGNSISLGGSITAATILSGTGVFSGSAQIPNSSIANAQLANSSVTIGSTGISLGGTSTTLAGLTQLTTTAIKVTSAAEVTGSFKVMNGATKVIDTTVGNLYDVYGGTSVNFGSNQLLNYYGANVVNWGSNFLLSNNNTSATTMSIDWESRYLADTAGTQRLKWTTSGVQVTGSLVSTGGFTGSLQGTASIAITALSASSILPSTVTGIVPVPFMSTKTPGVAAYLGGDTTLTYNTSTGTLNASGFSGTTFTGTTFTGTTFSGNAATATTAQSASTALVTTNAVHYPIFVDANNLTPASEKLGTIAGYNFNPGTTRLEITGSLFATNITGSLRGTASYATMASQSGYTMQFVLATTGSNPAASTTYRLGAPVRTQLNTTSGRTRIYVPRPGKVGYAHLYIRTNGTLASAGTSTLSLGKNSSISETIATSTTAGSSADAVVSSTAISMSVAQGDFLEINWVTPAWATLPTGVEASGIIYIENNI